MVERKLSRRDFIKITAGTAVSAAATTACDRNPLLTTLTSISNAALKDSGLIRPKPQSILKVSKIPEGEPIPIAVEIPRAVAIPLSEEETNILANAPQRETILVPEGDCPEYFSNAIKYWWNTGKIKEWSDKYNVNPLVIATIMQIESCGHPGLTSSAGAKGLFQVMPQHFTMDEDPFDSDTNARVAMRVYNEALQTAKNKGFKDTEALIEAAKGYNGGPRMIGTQPAVNSENWRYEKYFRVFLTGQQETIDVFFSIASSSSGTGMCDKADQWLQTQLQGQSNNQERKNQMKATSNPLIGSCCSRVGVPFGAWSYFQHNGHTGIDLNAEMGQGISAVADGTVIWTDWLFGTPNTATGHGITVVIDHGGWYTVYAHGLEGSVSVHNGQEVKAGQLLSKVGMTGATSGPHLHFALLGPSYNLWQSVNVETRGPLDSMGIPSTFNWIDPNIIFPQY